MDSSLAEQMLDTYPLLTPFRSLFKLYEQIVVKNALGVAPACQALSAIILAYKPNKVVVLQDVSVLTD